MTGSATTRTILGAMSGTSLDGVDAVAVVFGPGACGRVIAHAHRPFDDELKHELLALNTRGGADELHRAALAANSVARAYAATVAELLPMLPPDAPPPQALGAHGQTVRHQPALGFSLQLLNAALLAELLQLDVVADFRSADVAAGGHGAPLVPAFHAAWFARPGLPQALLNLGGIANLTLLPDPTTGDPARAGVGGFDCGPGNALMDLWTLRHRNQPWDEGGRFAAEGRVDAGLLARLLQEPYLALPPPKSTGRELFHAGWLAGHAVDDLPPADVQATLTAFTAEAAVQALARHQPACRRLLACGGGALNPSLMAALREALARRLPAARLGTTQDEGVPVMQVEAAAFAWLADAFLRRSPGNLPQVTGARGPRVLGALYGGRPPIGRA